MSKKCGVCGRPPWPSSREQIAEMEKRMVAMTEVIAAAEERGRLAANAAWRDALSEELHDIGATEIHSDALRKLFGGDDV